MRGACGGVKESRQRRWTGFPDSKAWDTLGVQGHFCTGGNWQICGLPNQNCTGADWQILCLHVVFCTGAYWQILDLHALGKKMIM